MLHSILKKKEISHAKVFFILSSKYTIKLLEMLEFAAINFNKK